MVYYRVNEWSLASASRRVSVAPDPCVLPAVGPVPRIPEQLGITFLVPGGLLVGNKLYVGNIAYEVDTDMLNEAFGQYGEVTECTIIMDRETGRSKGFGFVQMSSDSEARAALEGMDGVTLEGRPIRVSEARPREDRGPRGGGGGGGGGRGGGGGGRDRY